MFTDKINQKIQSIEKENLLGISLMGSHSRGDFGKFSDIDIVCFTKEVIKDVEVFIIDKKLIVISYVTDKEVENWFTSPEKITEILYGLTKLITIWDSNNYLKNLKNRANSFTWNDDLSKKIHKYVNKELTLLIEEVNKGIQGLINKDKGRMLNCIFGLSHILAKIICVKKRILIKGDNYQYEQVLNGYKEQLEITILLKKVFGENPIELEERVKAGLQLFKEISTEFKDEMDKETLKMIKSTNNSIDWILNKN